MGAKEFLLRQQVKSVMGMLLFGVAGLGALLILSQINIGRFHAIAEFVAVAIAFSLFLVVWNSRDVVANGALLLLGGCYLFVGVTDMPHSWAHAGTGLLDGGEDLGLQLWLVARGLEALSFLIAPFLLTRFLRGRTFGLMMLAYAAVTALALLCIFQWKVFPTCYVEGQGQTAFKMASEGILVGLMVVAGIVLFRRRGHLAPQASGMLLAAIGVSALAELAFVGQAEHGDLSCLSGDLLKIVAFYLLYLVIIRRGLKGNLPALFPEHLPVGQAGLRMLLGNLPQKIFCKDVNSVYVSCNENFARDVGLSPEQVVGKTDYDLYPEALAEKYRNNDRRIMAAGEVEELEEAYIADGRERMVLTRKIPLADDAGQPIGVLGVLWDVTEKWQAQKGYQALFNEMVTGVAFHEMIFDESGKPVDYRFLAVNPAFEELTGLLASRVEGKTVLEVLPGTEPYWIELYGKVVATGEPVRFENHSRELGRSYEVAAYPSGENGFVCTFIDITSRQDAQRGLEEAQHLAHLGSWELDLQTERMSLSVEMCRLFGLPPDLQMTHDLFVERILQDDWAAYEEAMRQARDYGISHFEYRIMLPNGRSRWMQGYGRLIPQHGKQPARVVGTVQDVTEQRDLEAQLLHAQKMEAIGQLAGGIAHDFNNILAAVQGYADLLSLDLPPGSRESRHAEAISSVCRRAGDLTGQLLSFARRGDYRRAATDIHAIVEEVTALLRHSMDRRIDIAMDLHADPSVIMGDPTQLQNALLNLGVNARDAMPEGGVLAISTRNVVLDEQYSLSVPYRIELGPYVEIRVSDTGVGMDEETKERVFEPFFTTKQIGEGTGLGLAAVYGFVKNHKGSIEVESAPGQGSTFIILLPQSQESAVAPEATPPLIAHGQGHILIIDDEQSIRDFASTALRKMGYTVEAYYNGIQGILYYKEHGDEVDLVILDLVMPEMGGEEVFRTLHQMDPKVKVLIMSGYSDARTMRRLLAEGASGLLRKPFPIRELSVVVARALASAADEEQE